MAADLSVSLNKVGDAASAWAGRRTPSAPTAEAWRYGRCCASGGGHASAARPERVAEQGGRRRVASLGRLEDAERASAETWQYVQVLRQRLGIRPKCLRDLSVSLDRVGDAARALGRLEDADGAYAENLAVWRVLRSGWGHARSAARLSMSLNKVGDAASALGRLERRARLRRGPAVMRVLRQRLGTRPEGAAT